MLAVLVLIAGVLLRIHATFLLVSLVGAAGLIWSSREWKAWVLAAMMVAAGPWWPAWWRGMMVHGKLSGHLSYLEWKDIWRIAPPPGMSERFVRRTRLLREKRVEGQKWGLYETELGKF